MHLGKLLFQCINLLLHGRNVDFGLLLEGVYIARDVEVVVVLFNLFQGGAMAVFPDFGTISVGFDNLLDMFRTELILRFNLFEFA